MHRRDFCRTLASVASLAAAPACMAGQDSATAAPGDSADSTGLGSRTRLRKLLFFDLWKLDAWHNLQRVQGTPEFVEEATYIDDTLPGKGAGKPSVFYDAASGVWRMLYNLGWSPIRLMAAVSDDGLHWQPDPHPEIAIDADVPGGKLAEHHVFGLADAAAGGLYVDPVAADGFPYKLYAQQGSRSVHRRAVADADHPWHAIAKAEGEKRYFHDELMLVSKDGMGWQPRREYAWSRADWHPEPPYFGFYNRGLQCHAMTVRPGWGDRRVALQRSDDFRTWSDPELLLQMDPLDDTPVGFYAMPVFPYGPMYVGLLWVFHNASSRVVGSFNQFFGSMDAQLTYSYDGIRFVRGPRHALLPRNPFPEFGCAQVRPYSMVLRDHEILFYSGASQAPHGREGALGKAGVTRQAIIVHRLREDGLSYLTSRGDWARLQTKPFAIWTPEITLNAQAAFGEIRYQITDERSVPVEGYTWEDCIPLQHTDRYDWSLRWKDAHLEALLGKVLRLEIEFQNAEIYSLAADYHFLDAQDQWMLKDGKTIERDRFDF